MRCEHAADFADRANKENVMTLREQFKAEMRAWVIENPPPDGLKPSFVHELIERDAQQADVILHRTSNRVEID